MDRRAFPACEVIGPVDPVPYTHMLSGAIPRKCSGCRFLFEGECTRAMDQVHGYLALDHGPCPVIGDTTPTLVVTKQLRSTVSIPAKCRSCEHLEVSLQRGFTCGFEREKWGFFRRGLDWGSWSPELPNVGLESGRPVSLAVLRAAASGNEAETIKAFRADFPDATFSEARQAFAALVEQLKQSR
ncbi:MAG: hypothetical protein ABTQ32_31935 [Myxococcaceae bacterium]